MRGAGASPGEGVGISEMAELKEYIVLLAFLSLFHIVGGLVFGTTLRGLGRRITGRSIFLLVWSLFFGGVPLLMFLQSDWPWWVHATRALVLFGSVALGFFLKDSLHGLLQQGHIVTMILGGVFMTAGAGLVASGIVAEDFPLGLLMGTIFFLVGLGIFVIGFRGWKKEDTG